MRKFEVGVIGGLIFDSVGQRGDSGTDHATCAILISKSDVGSRRNPLFDMCYEVFRFVQQFGEEKAHELRDSRLVSGRVAGRKEFGEYAALGFPFGIVLKCRHRPIVPHALANASEVCGRSAAEIRGSYSSLTIGKVDRPE